MTNNHQQINPVIAHRLLQAGVLLFLLGLSTGLVLPMMSNPRMGLSSHLEGLMNGLFLIALGLLWPRLILSPFKQKLTAGLALYGSFTNWLVVGLAGFWGAGGKMMPIAGQGHHGSQWQEALIGFGLISLSVSVIAVCLFVLAGLRLPSRPPTRDVSG